MIEFYQNWQHVQALPVSDDLMIEEIIPANQSLRTLYYLCRSETVEIPPGEWSVINDPEFIDLTQKSAYVARYFSVVVHELRNVKSVAVAAYESIVTEGSSSRRLINRLSVDKNESFENKMEYDIIRAEEEDDATDELAIKGKETKEFRNLRNPVEHQAEDNCSQREIITYSSMGQDRNVVWWNLIRVQAIYREDNADGKIKLIAIDDCYLDTFKKTYMRP